MQKDCDINVLPGTLTLRLFLDSDETRLYTVDQHSRVGEWLSKLASDGVLTRRSQTLLVFPVPGSGLKNPVVLGDRVEMMSVFSGFPAFFPSGEVADVFMTDIDGRTGELFESQASSLSLSTGSFSFDFESPPPSLGVGSARGSSIPPTVPARGSNAPLPSHNHSARTSSGYPVSYTSTESMTSSEPRFSDSPDTFTEAIDEVLAARRPSRPSEHESTSPLSGLLGAAAPPRGSRAESRPSSVRGSLRNMDDWFD